MAVHAMRAVLMLEPVDPNLDSPAVRDDVRALNWMPLERLGEILDWFSTSRWHDLASAGEGAARGLIGLRDTNPDLLAAHRDEVRDLAMSLIRLSWLQIPWLVLVRDFLAGNPWVSFEDVQVGCKAIAERVEGLIDWAESGLLLASALNVTELRRLLRGLQGRAPLLKWVESLEAPLSTENREGLRLLAARYRVLHGDLWELIEHLDARS